MVWACARLPLGCVVEVSSGSEWCMACVCAKPGVWVDVCFVWAAMYDAHVSCMSVVGGAGDA